MYGFSDKLGPINYERKRNAGETYQLEGSSDATLDLIDSEIKNIIVTKKKKTEELLKNKKKDLITLAEALLEYETLDKEEVEKVLKGEKLTKKDKDVDYNNVNFSIFSPFLAEEENEKEENNSQNKEILEPKKQIKKTKTVSKQKDTVKKKAIKNTENKTKK